MKSVTILHRFYKGIRLPAILLSVIMTWAIFCGLMACGRTLHIQKDMAALRSPVGDDLLFLIYFPGKEEMMMNAGPKYAAEFEKEYEALPYIQQIFSVKVAPSVECSGKNSSIVIYEPGFTEAFPNLKTLGIAFADSTADGCVAPRGFASEDGNVHICVKDTEVSLPLAGYLSSANRYFALTNSATTITASDFFVDGEILIVQGTEANMQTLNTLGNRVQYNSNLVVRFSEDATPEERSAFIQEASYRYIPFTYRQVMEKTQERVTTALKQNLPLPVFLAISSFFAYVSVTVLCIQSREKLFATMYLCGYPPRRCGIIAAIGCQLPAVPAIVLNTALVLIWPRIPWGRGRLLTASWAQGKLYSLLFYLFSLFESISLTKECFAIILCYAAVTAALSFGVVFFTLRRHSPISFLRRAAID